MTILYYVELCPKILHVKMVRDVVPNKVTYPQSSENLTSVWKC